MKKVILQTHNLRKEFGEVVAVDGIDFPVYEGEVFGFLGPGSAGDAAVGLHPVAVRSADLPAGSAYPLAGGGHRRRPGLHDPDRVAGAAGVDLPRWRLGDGGPISAGCADPEPEHG